MTIAVDFDGTIVEHRYPEIGKPRPMAFEVLKALRKDGHRLILWSNREGDKLTEAVEYCRRNGVEFYAVNSEYPDASWSGSGVSRKIIADVYIDDKNIGGLLPWDVIYQKLSHRSMQDARYRYYSGYYHHEEQGYQERQEVRTYPSQRGYQPKRAENPDPQVIQQLQEHQHHRHHHHKEKKFNFFKGIVERCKDAQRNFKLE